MEISNSNSIIHDARKEIDIIDAKMVTLLLKRNNLSKIIGTEKMKRNMEVYDRSREETIYSKFKSMCTSDEFLYIKPIFEAIIYGSRNSQSSRNIQRA